MAFWLIMNDNSKGCNSSNTNNRSFAGKSTPTTPEASSRCRIQLLGYWIEIWDPTGKKKDFFFFVCAFAAVLSDDKLFNLWLCVGYDGVKVYNVFNKTFPLEQSPLSQSIHHRDRTTQLHVYTKHSRSSRGASLWADVLANLASGMKIRFSVRKSCFIFVES